MSERLDDSELPPISVVIATYNAGHLLDAALGSVARQDYPADKIEIVLVDDASEDNTIEVARRYTDCIHVSGRHFCEISRAKGITLASHELVLFLDADNVLPDAGFLRASVAPFLDDPELVGSFPVRFHYDRTDPGPNRYCSLFGINDPFQFYSKAREHLAVFETTWCLQGQARDRGDDYLLEFPTGSLLTLGAIGFLGRRDLMLGEIRGEFFFHSDAFNRLIHAGHNRFAATKQSIIHDHCSTTPEFLRKLARNFRNFLLYHGNRDREHNWATANRTGFVLNVLLMSTFVIPLWDSIRGFIKKPDLAWFYHPAYCFLVVAMYSTMTVRHLAGRAVGRRSPSIPASTP